MLSFYPKSFLTDNNIALPISPPDGKSKPAENNEQATQTFCNTNRGFIFSAFAPDDGQQKATPLRRKQPDSQTNILNLFLPLVQ